MTTLSTHVLDAALGRPAVGLGVALDDADQTTTDSDGRLALGQVAPGEHVLTFATGPWFTAQGRDTLYPTVRLAFEVAADQQHYHLALLLSPYSYTTYRGS